MMFTYPEPGNHGTGFGVLKWMADGCHIHVISGPALVPASKSWMCRQARTNTCGVKRPKPQEYQGPFISDPNEIVIGIRSAAILGARKSCSHWLYPVLPESPIAIRLLFLGISSSTDCAPAVALFRISVAGKAVEPQFKNTMRRSTCSLTAVSKETMFRVTPPMISRASPHRIALTGLAWPFAAIAALMPGGWAVVRAEPAAMLAGRASMTASDPAARAVSFMTVPPVISLRFV